MLLALTAVSAVASAEPVGPVEPVDPVADENEIAADLADEAGELPDLLPEAAGFAAGPDPADDLVDRHGSPMGRLELTAEWLRHDTLTADVLRQVDEAWVLLAWRR